MNVLAYLVPKKETKFVLLNFTVRQAIEVFDYHKFATMPILDEEGKYIGSISEGDVLRFIKNECNFSLDLMEEKHVHDIPAYRPYKSVTITSSDDDIISLSLEQNFVPIVDDRGMYIGLIQRRAILSHLKG